MFSKLFVVPRTKHWLGTGHNAGYPNKWYPATVAGLHNTTLRPTHNPTQPRFHCEKYHYYVWTFLRREMLLCLLQSRSRQPENILVFVVCLFSSVLSSPPQWPLARTVETGVELLRQQSYAIKNQHVASKDPTGLCFTLVLYGRKSPYKRSFPGMEAKHPYAIKN